MISYSADELIERPAIDAHAIGEIIREDEAAGRITWIDIQGLRDTETLERIRDLAQIHPLAFADIMNLGQRPKADDYDDALFVALRMATMPDGALRWEQVSVFARARLVVSVQERSGDCLEPLRDRLRQGRRTIRSSAGDYLMAMIVDAIVDGYFPLIDAFGERLEEIEEVVIDRPDRTILSEIFRIKRELLLFRRAVWPLRDALSGLLRDDDSPILLPQTRPYLRDTLDHVMQVFDIVETYREMSASFIDIYLSSVANRTNEVMRVLTVVAAIFVPITFIAGVYGMNFDHMPELHWKHGYAMFWILVALLTMALLGLFYRLGWLRPGGGDR